MRNDNTVYTTYSFQGGRWFADYVSYRNGKKKWAIRMYTNNPTSCYNIVENGECIYLSEEEAVAHLQKKGS